MFDYVLRTANTHRIHRVINYRCKNNNLIFSNEVSGSSCIITINYGFI